MMGKVCLKDLSIANLTVGGGDPIALIEAAGAAGFGAVGLVLRTAMPKPISHEIVGRPEVIRAIKATCGQTGVRVFDVEAFTLRADADFESYKQALDAGAQIGATHISCVGSERLPGAVPQKDAERIDIFGRLCDLAATFGLHVGLEFMRYRDVQTLQHTLALMKSADRPNCGVILDLLHFDRSGGKVDELKGLAPKNIAYVQLCDAGPTRPILEGLAIEARTNRLPLGTGALPLNEILNILPGGPQLVVEIPVKGEETLTTMERVKKAAERTQSYFAVRK